MGGFFATIIYGLIVSKKQLSFQSPDVLYCQKQAN